MTKIRAVWLHRGPVDAPESCWAAGHERGRRTVAAELADAVETTVADDLGRGEPFAAAARAFAEDGYDVLYLCDSFGGKAVLPFVDEYPETRFEHCQGRELHPNVSAFREANDESAYVSGVLCGAMTRTGVLGCLGGIPGQLDITLANAWALGVRVANPEAAIHLRWVGSYHDADQADRERALLEELRALGADVFGGTLSENPTMAAFAAEHGCYAMGRDLRTKDNPAVLDVAYVDWAPYYRETLRAVIDGRWHPERRVLRYTEGVPCNTRPAAWVPAPARAAHRSVVEGLRAGTLDPWAGPLRDREGTVRVGAGQTLGDHYSGQPLPPGVSATHAYCETQMDWLVEGFVDPLPAA